MVTLTVGILFGAGGTDAAGAVYWNHIFASTKGSGPGGMINGRLVTIENGANATGASATVKVISPHE